MDLLSTARKHVGVTLAGGVLLLAGVGTATAVAIAPTSAESEVYEAPVGSTAPATSSAPEAPVVAPAPAPDPVAVDPPAVSPEPATVEPVTQPEVQPTPAAPTPDLPAAIEDRSVDGYDPLAPYVDGSGKTYVPAPDIPAEKLPGEPGYVPPAG